MKKIRVIYSRPLFLYFHIFNTVDSKQINRRPDMQIGRSLPMTGFEPRTSAVGSHGSTNWATTTIQEFRAFVSNKNAIFTYFNFRLKMFSDKKIFLKFLSMRSLKIRFLLNEKWLVLTSALVWLILDSCFFMTIRPIHGAPWPMFTTFWVVK